MLGADPEFIVAESGCPVPAPEGLPFAYDPPLVELNIQPAKSPKEFTDNVFSVVGALKEKVNLWPQEAAVLPSITPHVGAAKYAYRGGLPAPEAPLSRRRAKGGMWHYAGGHLHLSYDADILPYHMALLCDLYIGVPAARYDKQPRRRKIFGWPGLYRETSYGIEYRTLSNQWALNPMLCTLVADCAFQLLDDVDAARTKLATTNWCEVHQNIMGQG